MVIRHGGRKVRRSTADLSIISATHRETPRSCNSLPDHTQIRSTTTGRLIPLSAFAQVERKVGLLAINQLSQLPAVTISFNLPAGVSLGTAVQEIDALKATLGVPETITTSFTGTAQVFAQALANQGLLLGAAVLAIYIVLGILYESFVHPLTILTGLPAATAGALATLELFGFDLSVNAVIGILMLIGIVKKNAIMMIDFALVRQRAGQNSRDAIRDSCLVRFRTIMMTTLAALIGTLPIAMGAGARLGTAPAPRRGRRRRAFRVADPHAVHNARYLPLYGGLVAGPVARCEKSVREEARGRHPAGSAEG
jgi:HAE1 family hydrophobic/amphiphilic exporter-1